MHTFLTLITFEGWQTGPVFIHSWGLMAALGVAAAVWLASRKREKMGIEENDFWKLAVVMVVSVFLGARILYVIEMWEFYNSDIFSFFKVWEGGFSLFGGVIGGLLTGLLWARKRMSWQALGWMLTPAWVVGIMFGRIGCSLIHDHPGKITNLPFGVHVDGILHHEPALYEVVMLGAISILLVAWEKFERKRKIGYVNSVVFPLSLILYSGGRFWLDFFRELPAEGGDPRYLGLTLAQYISIAVFFIGIEVLVRKKYRKSSSKSF